MESTSVIQHSGLPKYYFLHSKGIQPQVSETPSDPPQPCSKETTTRTNQTSSQPASQLASPRFVVLAGDSVAPLLVPWQLQGSGRARRIVLLRKPQQSAQISARSAVRLKRLTISKLGPKNEMRLDSKKAFLTSQQGMAPK